MLVLARRDWSLVPMRVACARYTIYEYDMHALTTESTEHRHGHHGTTLTQPAASEAWLLSYVNVKHHCEFEGPGIALPVHYACLRGGV